MGFRIILIHIMILQIIFVTSRPMKNHQDVIDENTGREYQFNAQKIPTHEDPSKPDEQVISVRITSSVAVGRGKGKSVHIVPENDPGLPLPKLDQTTIPAIATTSTISASNDEEARSPMTEIPPNLIGANIEFIKQLNAKKEIKELNTDQVHPFQLAIKDDHTDNDESQFKSEDDEYTDENIKDIPLARSIPLSYYANQLNSKNDTTYVNNSQKQRENDTNFLGEFPGKSQKKQIIESDLDHSETDDSIAEASIKSVLEVLNKNNDNDGNINVLPLVRSVPPSPSSQNYNIQVRTNKPLGERENGGRLTTVNFNILHDVPKTPNNYNEPTNTYINPSRIFTDQQKLYEAKIYSEPAKYYSEPAKIYSEPAKIYSEPAKIYSEPAKIYSEPAKIYSEPAKFYSEPASLHLPNVAPSYTPWQQQSRRPTMSTSTVNMPPITTLKPEASITRIMHENQPEKNYEVEERDSIISNGRTHGVQESTTEKCKQDNCKVGYVVEGRQYKKYRVEERTSDGFIVGEYGVVRNEDGALRGVRYTADSDASPRLIYDALMKFLQLK